VAPGADWLKAADPSCYRRTAGGTPPPPIPRPRPRPPHLPPCPPPIMPPIWPLAVLGSAAGSEPPDEPVLAGMMVMVFPGGSSCESVGSATGVVGCDAAGWGAATTGAAGETVDFKTAGTIVGWNVVAWRRVRRTEVRACWGSGRFSSTGEATSTSGAARPRVRSRFGTDGRSDTWGPVPHPVRLAMPTAIETRKIVRMTPPGSRNSSMVRR
jgi:hypothetical protein